MKIKYNLIKFFIFISCLLFFPLSGEEIVKRPLEDSATRNFLFSMLSVYWKRADLPCKRLNDIFNILEKYGDDGELAMLMLHEKYPDMADPTSSFINNYKRARAKKFDAYARSLVTHVKEGILLDFGAGDTQLATTLVSLDPKISQAYATDIFPFSPSTIHPKVCFIQQASPDSTPFGKDSIDTIILSTVSHHILPEVRRSLFAHLYTVLKPGGRIILIEDSFHERPGLAKNELESIFFALNVDQQKDVLCFLDWWGNRLMKNRAEIPLPCTFKTIEEWIPFLEDYGLTLIKAEFEGFPPIPTHMVSPKAIMIFEKPISNTVQKESNYQIKRVDGPQKILGFLPQEGVKINLSIGGTKILINAIDRNGKVLYASSPYKWRDEAPTFSSYQEKRTWIVQKMLEEINKAKDKLGGEKIEGVGFSWAGPVSKNGRCIGPNIIGFSFKDLNDEEQIQGGIDLIALIKERLSPNWQVQILNDADEEALSEFVPKKISEGTLLILGTGIGAGIIHNGSSYFGPAEFTGRMGEIGHHIIFDDHFNKYSYYGLESRGEILKREGSSFTDRLSAPHVAKRFLLMTLRESGHSLKSILSYLNDGEEFFNMQEIESFFQKQIFPFSLEEKTLRMITEKAARNDSRARRFIHAIGFEIGLALRTFAECLQNPTYLSEIHLGGSLGRLFGKEVYGEHGKEIFLDAIEEGLINE